MVRYQNENVIMQRITTHDILIEISKILHLITV
jgi:hypothetical protein